MIKGGVSLLDLTISFSEDFLNINLIAELCANGFVFVSLTQGVCF